MSTRRAPSRWANRVIGLTMTPVPHVRFEPVEFPASEIYHFEPLDERVPVYQQPFMLLQEVVVSGAAEVEDALAELDALTLTGTLDYQACNDELCFDPVSVPLSFTLDLDSARPATSGSLAALRRGAEEAAVSKVRRLDDPQVLDAPAPGRDGGRSTPTGPGVGLTVFTARSVGGRVIMVIPAVTVIHYGVVKREERYLEANFGDEYREYKTTVRRWV